MHDYKSEMKKVLLLLMSLFALSCAASWEDRLCIEKCSNYLTSIHSITNSVTLYVSEAKMSRFDNTCYCEFGKQLYVSEKELCGAKK